MKEEIKTIDVSLIDPPETPDRIEIDQGEVESLAASIKEVGLLQPILVRPNNGRYEVIAGDRRLRALKSANIQKVNALVKDIDKKQVAIIRATENLKRENLTPLEEAKIYIRMSDELGMTWEEIGKKIGKSPATCKRRTDILRMPECLQIALHKKQIQISVAESLWRITDQTALEYYLSFAIENGVTVSVARDWANEYEKSLRTNVSDTGGGGILRHPSEISPIYVACDLCKQPVEIGNESVLRVCPHCLGALMEAKRNLDQ
ncbi:MAG: ParB/RepB/Spo0J family partition protein [Methanocellales archaeon]|nr:ParB/RepB/Spo0J family partition protein [Methanocellales archaeon]